MHEYTNLLRADAVTSKRRSQKRNTGLDSNAIQRQNLKHADSAVHSLWPSATDA